MDDFQKNIHSIDGIVKFLLSLDVAKVEINLKTASVFALFEDGQGVAQSYQKDDPARGPLEALKCLCAKASEMKMGRDRKAKMIDGLLR